MLVVGEEGVGHPDLFGEVARQRQDDVLLLGEGQPLVPPVLIQAQGQRIILRALSTRFSLSSRRWKPQIAGVPNGLVATPTRGRHNQHRAKKNRSSRNTNGVRVMKLEHDPIVISLSH